MLKDTQLTPDWEKKFDPPTIDRLPRMKWQQLVQMLIEWASWGSECYECPCRESCQKHGTLEKASDACQETLTEWAKSMMRCEWDG